jgi:APA family basic amino acid/polyamine antiporter
MASYFVRKPVHLAEAERSGLKRVLGPLELTLLGIGAIIGTGIFVLTGTASAGEFDAAGNMIRAGAGPSLTISFIVTGIACGFAALCYAEFASMIPVAGSAYTYAYTSFGELVAWIIGWDLILEYAVGNVAVAIGWSAYFQGLLQQIGTPMPVWLSVDPMTASRSPELLAQIPTIAGIPLSFNLSAMVAVFLVTILLVVGVKESARTNAILVVIKLVMIALFVIVGVGHIDPVNYEPFSPNGWQGVMTGAALIFFAYIGFDAVSTTAEEAKNPQRDLPIGMIASLLVCTVLYILVTIVLTGLLPLGKIASGDMRVAELAGQLGPTWLASPVASALRLAGQGWAASIISAGAILSISSVLVVMQMGQTRIFFAMSRDGLLPKIFSKVHDKYKTPATSTILTGILVAVPAGFIDISAAADLSNIGTLFAFVLVSVGIIILRRTNPDAPRGFRVPFAPVTPIITVLVCLYLMSALPLVTWERFFIWLAIGLVFYFAYGARNSVLRNKAAA